jgi:hypothetical protein
MSELPAGLRIIEGLMTTLSPGDGGPESRVNIAPMGPLVDTPITQLVLRPFKTSTTYRNLKATGQGVFHITDDVMLLARAAIGRVVPDGEAPVRAAQNVEGLVLAGACRYHEVRVVDLDDRQDRTHIVAKVVHSGELRPFLGLSRALHAVVEAAILATRVHLTGADFVLAQYESLQVLVDKTGTDREHQAMRLLRQHVSEAKLKVT